MTIYRFYLILTCILSFFLFTGCEKAPLQTTSNEITSNDVISTRTECLDCPNETDCCCGIELQDPIFGSATLRICGTTTGALSCPGGSPPSPCVTITGGGETTGMLNDDDPKHLFCMVPGNSFYITNIGSTTADIYVGCLYDQTNGARLTISIPATEIWYFETTNSCLTARCI